MFLSKTAAVRRSLQLRYSRKGAGHRHATLRWDGAAVGGVGGGGDGGVGATSCLSASQESPVVVRIQQMQAGCSLSLRRYAGSVAQRVQESRWRLGLPAPRGAA